MGGGGVLVMMWLISVCSTQEPCGPNNRCTCRKTTMDCSGKQFQRICGICNSILSQKITHLYASNNNINSIDFGFCVTGCKNLSDLDLNHNRITTIGAEVFKTMSRLTYLDVSSNRLSIYTKEGGKLFQHLRNVRTLKINDNVIDHSDTSMHAYPDLSNLTSLENLHMDGLRDSTFDSSFSKLTHLTSLFMSSTLGKCDLGELHDRYFQHLGHIETLSLSDCNIANIDLLTFALPNLRWLDLSHNQRLGFETLHNVSYSLQFTNIELLNYSYVYNTFGPSTILKKHNVCYLWNTTLKHIILNKNRVAMLESNVPILFPQTLQTISAQYNLLHYESYILQIGCLSNVAFYDGSFLGFPRDLRLSFIEQPRFPPNKEVFPNAKGCPFMQEDFMKNISSTINGCPFIEDPLNPFLYLPVLSKNLEKVQVTDSRLNFALKEVLLTDISHYRYLNLSGFNYICPWTGPIPSGSVQVLDLSRNNCDNVSSNLFTKNRDNLEIIHVSQNFIGLHIENMERTFQNLTNLKKLDISDNNIAYIPYHAFYGLSSLETLDLSVNLLSEWTPDVQMLTNINNIILNNNFLEALPDNLTSYLVKVSSNFSLDLRNNKLKYHCKYQSFLHWIVEHKGNLVGFEEYVFLDEDGEQITSSDITSRVEQLSTKCRNNTVWIVLSSVGVTLGVSVIAFVFVYRNRWKLRYFYYKSKQRFYGVIRVQDGGAPIENFRYNALVSYAKENLPFVRDEIIPNIEQNGISLCIYQRNSLPGNNIADNIMDAIQSSRKTVVLLSKAFLKRKWCMYEFNMARMETIYARDESCLVIVMLEKLPAKDIPLEIMNVIRTDTFIEYTREPEGQLLFWEQLRQAITA